MSSKIPRIAVPVVLAVAGLAAVAIPATEAGAKPATATTLHFFQKTTENQFYNAAWKPVNIDPPATLPVNGDSFDETDLDYAGTAKRHAKSASVTDHLACTFTKVPEAICSAQFAIGGSMLLVNHFKVDAAANSQTIKFSEGTGRFKGTRAKLKIVDVGSDANVTITGL